MVYSTLGVLETKEVECFDGKFVFHYDVVEPVDFLDEEDEDFVNFQIDGDISLNM